jgi:hypothetical protein
MSNESINTTQELIQKLVLDGDLSKMTQQQKVVYYNHFCQTLGLNPLTQPFQLIKFQGKERMYATKDCTEQLRKIHSVSITDVQASELHGVYVVTAKAIDKTGKQDAATGVVSIDGLKGDNLANALMKAETKAKRRVTLSICGLGILDESEIDTMKGAIIEDASHEIVAGIGDVERDELFALLESSTYEGTVKDKLFVKINGLYTREDYDKAKQTLLANQLGIEGAKNPSQKEINQHIKKIAHA